MTLRLEEHPDGVRTEDGARVVYDIDRNVAFFGLARVDGPALVWEVEDPGPGDWVVASTSRRAGSHTATSIQAGAAAGCSAAS